MCDWIPLAVLAESKDVQPYVHSRTIFIFASVSLPIPSLDIPTSPLRHNLPVDVLRGACDRQQSRLLVLHHRLPPDELHRRPRPHVWQHLAACLLVFDLHQEQGFNEEWRHDFPQAQSHSHDPGRPLCHRMFWRCRVSPARLPRCPPRLCRHVLLFRRHLHKYDCVHGELARRAHCGLENSPDRRFLVGSCWGEW